VSQTKAEVVLSSVCGRRRLTTFLVTFPRPYLAEKNTHRIISKNSASSRAIPPEKQLEAVMTAPYIPEFRIRTTGMGAGELMSVDEQAACVASWLRARDQAAAEARYLIGKNADKSRINRLLEPYMYHTAILSGTHWSNFFGLRYPHDGIVTPDFPAQTEFQELTVAMFNAMKSNTPQPLEPGEWHLPFVTQEEIDANGGLRCDPMGFLPALSAGRNARVSYLKHADDEATSKTIERAAQLAKSGHFSPLEHPAVATNTERWYANFSGFRQLRSFYPDENNAGKNREDLQWLQEWE
jgi:hypothetical protein